VDETDLAVAPLEPHYVAGLGIGTVFEDRDHFPTFKPGWSEPYATILAYTRRTNTSARPTRRRND
jgi:hypothetical protein